VRFLSNALGQVTDTYDYDAFGTLLVANGATANSFLYCGEMFDADLGLYYLRARLMNPLTGRMWTADSYEGRQKDPRSLHKYMYANGDGVNYSDPSGYRSLTELMASTAINDILTTISTAQRVLGVINKVNTFVDLMMGLQQLFAVLGGGLGGELELKDWKKMLPEPEMPNLDDAAITFGELATQGFGVGSVNWIAGYALELAKGRKIDSYLIYLPTFIGWTKEKRISLGGIKIGGKPLMLVAGAFGKAKIGSLLGLGVGVGRENIQLLRMDYHIFNKTHGGADGVQEGEMSVLRDGRYHMHVYEWGNKTNEGQPK